MMCDHFDGALTQCKNEPMRAPRVVVPSKTWLEPGHIALKMMTTLHYCEWHKGELKLADVLNAKIKVDFERVAKAKRPLDFKCDFDAAFIEWVLVTTPEYREWMSKLGAGRIMRLATQQ